jgi:hypothetical protein
MKLRTIFAAFAAATATAAIAVAPASADYGPGALYQVEITVNEGGHDGGGIWLWLALDENGTGDYAGSDCGHAHGAAADRGDVTWTSADGVLTISGVVLNGFGPLSPVPVTITVPSQYGHYAYSADAFTAIFSRLPPFISGGKGQVQVAP